MKQKNISREQYIATFCMDKRIRNRQVLYVTRAVHEKLHEIAHTFRKQHVTVASLVDTILAHHIEVYGQMLDKLRDEQIEEFIESFNRVSGGKDEQDSA